MGKPTDDGDGTTELVSEALDYAPWPSPLYRDIVEELSRFHRRKSEHHADAILETSAFAILLVLSDGRPRTLRELTDELELEQSTINRQVNAAIKHGYLERFEVEGSLSRLIQPTEHGRSTFTHDGMLRVGRLKQVFADLAPGTPESLLAELRAFNEAYDRTLRAERRRALDSREHG